MLHNEVYTASIRTKKSNKRLLLLVFGNYSHKDFIQALKENIQYEFYDVDDFDFRTIKFHDYLNMPNVNIEEPNIVILRYVLEDFGFLKELDHE